MRIVGPNREGLAGLVCGGFTQCHVSPLLPGVFARRLGANQVLGAPLRWASGLACSACTFLPITKFFISYELPRLLEGLQKGEV